MMYTRRTLFAVLAAIPVTAAGMAQGGGRQRGRGGPGMGGNQLEMLKERLNLSPEQEEKVKKIFEGQAAKMREMREKAQGGGDRSAMREQMMKLREDANKQMADVLSKEQMEEYDKIQQEMRERMGNRGRGGSGGQQRQQQ